MKRFKIEVQPDLLERLSKVRKPLLAVSELIWNSLDADATRVEVVFQENLLHGLERIVVSDNGLGMNPTEAEEGFKSLGGSWKRHAARSRSLGRLLHGRAGKGRLRAFALGANVDWKTTYSENGHQKSYFVRANLKDLGFFEFSDAVRTEQSTGTEVEISDPPNEFPSLRGHTARLDLTQQFAPYLEQYPNVQIEYDGRRLEPAMLKARSSTVEIPALALDDGRNVSSVLKIVEWNVPVDRGLFLCDSSGFAFEREPADVYAPGFSFTAYLCSDWIRELHEDQILELDELRPEQVLALIARSRKALKEYFRGRQAESAADLVADWKREESYPFRGEPESQLDKAKREVFDIVAVNINSHLPDFSTQDPKSRRFSFGILKEALEESPAAVQRILTEVLELPKERQEELADLLDQISLNAIIGASKLVTHRLDFLRALELLVFDPETKKVLLERKQLHKILEHYTWLFGEQFTLSVSDRSLTAVLEKHLHLIGRGLEDGRPVKRAQGKKGIVDLMMSRRIPQPRADEREHLVVELKRPSQPVNMKMTSQIKSYAFAVANDERFRDTNTRWVFWIISNEIDEESRRESRQRLRPEGLLHDDAESRIQVWVKTWGQLVDDCRARLRFFKEALDYDATDDSALALLRTLHQKHLPTTLSE
jgi:hypothetical protein